MKSIWFFLLVSSFCVMLPVAVSHSHARAFQSGHDQEASCADSELIPIPWHIQLAVHSSPSVSLRASSTPFSIVYEVEWQGAVWYMWRYWSLARIRGKGYGIAACTWYNYGSAFFFAYFLPALHNLAARNCRGNYF